MALCTTPICSDDSIIVQVEDTTSDGAGFDVTSPGIHDFTVTLQALGTGNEIVWSSASDATGLYIWDPEYNGTQAFQHSYTVYGLTANDAHNGWFDGQLLLGADPLYGGWFNVTTSYLDLDASDNDTYTCQQMGGACDDDETTTGVGVPITLPGTSTFPTSLTNGEMGHPLWLDLSQISQPGTLTITVSGSGAAVYRYDDMLMQYTKVTAPITVDEYGFFGTLELHTNDNFTGGATIEARFDHDNGETDAADLVKVVLQKVDLLIFNGQGGTDPLSEDDEEAIGAFTVANLNDTDGDGMADSGDQNVANEVDLMKLKLCQPVPNIGGNVTLTVVSGSVALWEDETKGTAIALTGNSASFPTSYLVKTIWVELTGASAQLRDVVLELEYNGTVDTVNATGVWATKTGFRNSQISTTLADDPLNTNPASTQIKVVNNPGFSAGNWIILDGSIGRVTRKLTAVNGTILTMNGNLGVAWSAGDEVRQGLSDNVDYNQMLASFNQTGGRLGAAHITPYPNNPMEMEFSLVPAGVSRVQGIIFDITRQKECYGWKLDDGVWSEWVSNVTPDSFPPGDEEFNDDVSNFDTDAYPLASDPLERIYVYDPPGLLANNAMFDALITRFNFREFVRVNFDGSAFNTSPQGVVGFDMGSRCSLKQDWRSRMHLKEDANGLWERDNSNAGNNEVKEGHAPLQPR